MADLNTELESLLTTVAEADRPALRDLLTRNPNTASLLKDQSTVYAAFNDPDPTRLPAAVAAINQPATAAPGTVQTSPGAGATGQPGSQPSTANPGQSLNLTLDQVNALVSQRVKEFTASPDFLTAVDTRAQEKAQSLLQAERANLLGASAALSAQISGLYDAHRAEFGEPLNKAEFEKFYATEGPKYANDLQNTYNVYVQKRRNDKAVADGVAAALAARDTAQVPGGALPTIDNPLAPNFMDYNVKKIGSTVTPSEDANKAAQAFQSLQRNWDKAPSVQ